MPNSYLQSELSYVALDRRSEAVALAHQALDLRREVAQRPLDPNPWAFAIVAAVRHRHPGRRQDRTRRAPPRHPRPRRPVSRWRDTPLTA